MQRMARTSFPSTRKKCFDASFLREEDVSRGREIVRSTRRGWIRRSEAHDVGFKHAFVFSFSLRRSFRGILWLFFFCFVQFEEKAFAKDGWNLFGIHESNVRRRLGSTVDSDPYFPMHRSNPSRVQDASSHRETCTFEVLLFFRLERIVYSKTKAANACDVGRPSRTKREEQLSIHRPLVEAENE